jgi:hypothetical protein
MTTLRYLYNIKTKYLNALRMLSFTCTFPIFWDITPCSPLKINRRFRKNISPPSSGSKNKSSKISASKLAPAFTLVSCSASTLKTEAICSSETSVNFQRTTWHYIPSTLHNRRYEKLRSYISCLAFSQYYFNVLRCNWFMLCKSQARPNLIHLWCMVLCPGVHNSHPTASGLGQLRREWRGGSAFNQNDS